MFKIIWYTENSAFHSITYLLLSMWQISYLIGLGKEEDMSLVGEQEPNADQQRVRFNTFLPQVATQTSKKGPSK